MRTTAQSRGYTLTRQHVTTLRARLLLGFAIVLAMVAGGAVLLVRTQEAYLVELLDRQLQGALGPVSRRPLPPPVGVLPRLAAEAVGAGR